MLGAARGRPRRNRARLPRLQSRSPSPGNDAAGAGRAVTWVGWRLQRTETAIAAAILALICALLIPTGLTIAHAYKRDGLGGCLAVKPSDSCNLKIQAFQAH